MSELEGKVAYVPGGTGGLGQAIARDLAGSGARIVVGDMDATRVSSLVDSLCDAGYEARGVTLDARSVAEIARSVDGVCDHYGRCDILVNCVGIHREGSVLDMNEETFDSVLSVNLRAGMFLGQAVARRQVAAKNGGKQVHLLSVRSQLALRGKGYSAYTASKGGLLMIVKQHAVELAPHGINVNGVAPTFVHTEMAQHALQDSELRAKLVERIPLGRIADPDDVVGPVRFFCSKASDFVTGQVLYVDGGLTACQ